MILTIEIPQEFEDDFNKDRFNDCFGRVKADLKGGNAVLCGLYEYETLEMLEDALRYAEGIER